MNEYILVKTKARYFRNANELFTEEDDFIYKITADDSYPNLKGIVMPNKQIDITIFPKEWEINDENMFRLDRDNLTVSFACVIKGKLEDILNYFQELFSLIVFELVEFEILYRNEILRYKLGRRMLVPINFNGEYIYKLKNVNHSNYFKISIPHTTNPNTRKAEENYLCRNILGLETLFRGALAKGQLLNNQTLIRKWSEKLSLYKLEMSNEIEFQDKNNIQIEIDLIKNSDESLYFESEDDFIERLFEYNDEVLESKWTNEIKIYIDIIIVLAGFSALIVATTQKISRNQSMIMITAVAVLWGIVIVKNILLGFKIKKSKKECNKVKENFRISEDK